MTRLVTLVAVLAFVFAAPAHAHLVAKPHGKSLQARLHSQQKNLAHARYVARQGGGHSAWWHRHATHWLAPQLARTRRALHPPRSVVYSGNVVALGRSMAAAHGWVGYEWSALYQLWDRESSWSTTAQNPSGACGIPQSMASCFGGDAAAQIRWGLSYIAGRYKLPSRAWAFWLSNKWY